jgi:hypothetical protein
MREPRVVLDLAEWVNVAGTRAGTRSARWVVLNLRPRRPRAPARER